MKLQTKLIISFFVMILLMGITQSIFLQSRIQSTFKTYLDQYNIGYMERMKQNLELHYLETGAWDRVQELYFTSTSSMEQGQGHGMMMRGSNMNMSMSSADLILLDNNGKVIADTARTRIGKSGLALTGKKQDLIINGEKKGTLLLYQTEFQKLEKEFIHSTNLAIVISVFIASIMAVLFSIWISKKITNPLRLLVRSTKQITHGEKWNAVTIPTKDEFHELGEAFNEMADQLERNENVRQTLVADVAHELRTPLSILQGKLESVQEGAIQPTEEVILELTDEVYRLKRLVSDLQQLSLAEAGKLPLNKQQVNIKQLINRVCSHLLWLAEEKDISLKYDSIPAHYNIEIDADRMTQVIVNLIGNALQHTPEQGSVEIIAQEKKDSLILKVSDTGKALNIKQLINRVCSHLLWLAEEKDISLKYDSIPAHYNIEIDADRMTQVIVNLIGNALQHTPEQGSVEMTVQETKDSLILKVSDTGPGIPDDVLPFIFDRFYKRDPSRSRTESGTGLGLSIAKGFVEAHGGSIHVESELNKGTIFIITLKRKESQSESKKST